MGKAQILIVTTILLGVEYQAHLQLSSVETTWGFMSLREQWKIFPFEYPRT